MKLKSFTLKLFRISSILCALHVFFLLVFSQLTLTPEKVIIKVSDELKGLIIGAEVTLKSKSQEITLLTNEFGVAEFSNLSLGTYEIQVNSKGFEKYETKLNIEQRKTIKLEITLQIATVETSINVDENEPNNQNFSGTRVLSQNEIDKLPETSEGLEKALQQIAGPTPKGEKMPITVNGFPVGSTLPPKEAIRQVRINKNYFSAKYEEGFGGEIEIYTKAGLEKFGGGFYFDYDNSIFSARNPFLASRIPSQGRGFSFNLRGPLVAKKSSFIFSFSQINSESNSAINAITLNSDMEAVEFKSSIKKGFKRENFYSVLDFDISEKHKIFANFEYSDSNRDNLGVGQFRLSELAFDEEAKGVNFNISKTALLSKSLVNQIRAHLSVDKTEQKSHKNSLITEVQDAFISGGGQRNVSSQNSKFHVSNDTTWQIDGYSMYFGAKLRGVSIREKNLSNSSGRYVFAGGLAPLLNNNNQPIFGLDGNFVLTNISSLEKYRRQLLFSRLGYSPAQVYELGGSPSQFSIEKGEPNLKLNQYELGLYFQNSFSLRNDISLSFGIRYENQTNIRSYLDFAPRFGLIWLPGVNQKNKTDLTSYPKISVGLGFFYQRVNAQVPFSARKSNLRKEYLIEEPSLLGLYPNIPNISNLQDLSLISPTKRILDSKLKTPKVKSFLVAIDKQLPFGMTFDASVSISGTTNLLNSRNINAPINHHAELVFPLGKAAGNVFQTDSSGVSHHKSLDLGLSIPNLIFTNLSFRYSYQKVKDNIVLGSGNFNDAYDFSKELAPSDKIANHTFYAIADFSLPYRIQLSNIFNVDSGTPFNITIGQDLNGDGLFTERPSFANGARFNVIQTEYGLLNPIPNTNEEIIPRNLGRGKSRFVLDTRISKSISWGGDSQSSRNYSINLMVEFENILNVSNKANPIGNLSSVNFLKSTTYSTERIGFLSSTGPRYINFGVSFSF